MRGEVESPVPGNEAPTFNEYFEVIARRKWFIVFTALWAVLVGVAYSASERPLYAASAGVVLSRDNLPAALSGVTEDSSAKGDPDRLIQTKRAIAKSPTIAARTLNALGIGNRSPEDLLAETEIVPATNADVLKVVVRNSNPAWALRLATEYARQFTAYQRQLDTAALQRARNGVDAEIQKLKYSKQDHALYVALVAKDRQLQTMEALQTGNASVVQTNAKAKKVRPRPVRAGVAALAVGLIFGLIAAFVQEAFDRRIRSPDAVADALGLPQLGRLGAPPRFRRTENRLAMLVDPESGDADAFRVVRVHVESVLRTKKIRSMLITSSMPGEGKSTTAANLAIAIARAGTRVVLVDLDARRPALHRLFRLEGEPGVGEVLAGDVALRDAVVPVPIAASDHAGGARRENGSHGAAGANGHSRAAVLHVLTAGTVPPSVGEFVVGDALAALLQTLEVDNDLVLIDAPALLGGADAIALSDHVDALLLVSRLHFARKSKLKDLRRALATCGAPAIGVVVTGSAPDDYYGSYRIKSFDEASKHNRTRLFERLWLGRKAERTPAEGAGFSGDET
jgi:polysaccharide biosynthesis transport protein